MSLILHWRVADPHIATRWRGPAGLAEAVEREPLYPVAAVVGPPGSGGDAFFPPLAVYADATAPAPSGGAGSAAWSTVLNEPMFWDGLAWRTVAHFAGEASIPGWVPPGAIVASDFKNGRYWRQDIGVCSLGDIWEPGAGYNGLFQPESDIVPGAGIIGSQMPQAVPEVLAMLAPGGDGCTAVLDYNVAQGVGTAADAQLGLIFTEQNYTNEWGGMVLLSSPANPGGQWVPGFNALQIGDYDGTEAPFNYPWVAEMPGVAMLGPHRVAVSISAAGVAVAADGHGPVERSRNEFTYLPKSDPAWDMLVPACFDHDDAMAYLESAVFYPHKDAAELVVLTTPAAPPPPVNSAPPTISGLAWVGQTLTASPGSWTNSPASFAYQWRADGIDVAGATYSTYQLSGDELGAVMTVAVIAANSAGGGEEAVSDGTDPVTQGFSLNFATGTLAAAVSLTRAAGPATWFDASGVLQVTSSANVARFDHDPVTLDPRGLMVEPAATNLMLRSAEFNNASWAKSGLRTVTADTVVAPDGTTSAEKLPEDTATGNHAVYQSASMTAGPYTASVYFKAAERTYAAVTNIAGSARYGVLINLDTGAFVTSNTAGTPSGTAYAIEPGGSGWHRVATTQTASGAVTGYAQPALSNGAAPSWSGGAPTYAGTPGNGALAWGGQLEAGSVATSYIPTTGTTATRAKDEITVIVPAGYSGLLVTYDDDSTSSVACVEGANVYDSSDFSRFRIKSLEGVV